VPTLTQSFTSQTLSPGGAAITLDVRNYITVPGVLGSEFARFDTIFGRFSVELRNDVAPRHVANFLTYVQANDYANTFIHRSASLESAGGPASIVQGGGYSFRSGQVFEVGRRAPVALEYNLPNARGTLAAARTNDVNSATSEWYFNVRDNSTSLSQSNNGGYTVFGRVMGTGMSVVDAIAGVPRFNAGSIFTDIPLRNYATGPITEAHLVIINSVTRATLFPTGGGPSVVELSVQNSAPSVVSTVLSGSTLTVTPVTPGNANITVRAVDANGNSAEGSFTVSVAAVAPVYQAQPISQTVAAGSTVVFNASASGAATYVWEHNGVPIEGATSATLVLNNVSAADAGVYRNIATNSIGFITSNDATLSVVTTDPLSEGRLVNLSILGSAGAGAKVLTMGASVGQGDPNGVLPLLIRGIGPTLAQAPFNVGGVLPDPVMTFFAAGNTSPLDSNDNWGGNAALAAAFRSVAAFDLPAGSADSAMLRASPGAAAGGYTVQLTGKGDASGTVLAEIYDASGAARTPTTPRLINLSTLTRIDAGSDLAMGFVLGGQTGRTVLVRGVGPSLIRFGVDGWMADPKLELFSNDTGQRLASNDDWAGSVEIAGAAASVGAFPLIGGNSKDAVLLISLPPGAYSARLSGVGNTGGTAIIEVYEVR
jgi:cyclophilin family peptidyl-prolyl cis-trans isomerase